MDLFVPGETSWIPYSHFKAKFLGDVTSIPDLEGVVNVVGAKEPHNKFTVDITPKGMLNHLSFLCCNHYKLHWGTLQVGYYAGIILRIIDMHKH